MCLPGAGDPRPAPVTACSVAGRAGAGARAVVAGLAGHRRRPGRARLGGAARGGGRREPGARLLGGRPGVRCPARPASPRGAGPMPGAGGAGPRRRPRRPAVRAGRRRRRGAGAGGGGGAARAGGAARRRARRATSAASWRPPSGWWTRWRRAPGVECQAGVADGLFAAVLAARRGLAVGPGATPAFLAPLGVEELDREPEVDRSELVGLLRRLGLRSLGAFGALAPGDVASRFGADAVLAHRLARGLDPRPPVRRLPARGAGRRAGAGPARRPGRRGRVRRPRGWPSGCTAVLAAHGLSCTRLGVGARTVAGEELTGSGGVPSRSPPPAPWTASAGSSTPGWSGVVRGRAPAAAGARGDGRGGGAAARAVGEVGEADERAGRALVRVQAMLGPDAVVTAVLRGGRDPAERVRLVPGGTTATRPQSPASGRRRARSRDPTCSPPLLPSHPPPSPPPSSSPLPPLPSPCAVPARPVPGSGAFPAVAQQPPPPPPPPPPSPLPAPSPAVLPPPRYPTTPRRRRGVRCGSPLPTC